MHAVRAEIVILPLFAVRNNRRACGFKPLNGISNRIFIERSEIRILTVASCDSLDQINGSWDTANWLGGYRDWCRLGHTYHLPRSIIGLTLLDPKGFQCLHCEETHPNHDADASSYRPRGVASFSCASSMRKVPDSFAS